MKNKSDIWKLANSIVRITKQAELTGLFTDTRELLECQNCGLMEDIAAEGNLMTYKRNVMNNDEAQKDSYLRFIPTDNANIFICPQCGNCVELSDKETGQ
ncbi:MAG: hypothetical protein HQK79_04860 [Desulfobacterales bacterium]|nr:hypothetical protein [Desulfobacterales bacterium]MBF0395913.1 hypothetical protein [Desulfobacterales bacterium]